MRSSARRAVALLATAFALASCGADDRSGATRQAPTTSAAQGASSYGLGLERAFVRWKARIPAASRAANAQDFAEARRGMREFSDAFADHARATSRLRPPRAAEVLHRRLVRDGRRLAALYDRIATNFRPDVSPSERRRATTDLERTDPLGERWTRSADELRSRYRP